MSDSTKLSKITHVGDSTISLLTQDNIIEFFDWGILNAGGFFNIEIPTSGLYAGEKQTPKRWLALLPKLCERLNLDATQLLRIKHDAISFCHSYTPLNTHICAVNDYNHPSE